MPDPNLRAKVRETLNLAEGTPLTQQAMQGLSELIASRSHWNREGGSQIVYLTGLEHATNLTRLELDWNQIIDLGPLANLTQLRVLTVHYNLVRDLRPIAGLKALTELGLHHNPDLTDVSPLVGLTQLTSLIVSSNSINDISPLAGLTHLTRLQLDGNEIVDVGPLAGLTHLTHLQLSGIRDAGPLAGLTQLTHLGLAGGTIRDVSPLAGLTELQTLLLEGNQIVDVGPLASLTHLTHLQLQGNQISDITPLTHLGNLRQLKLAKNPIQDTAPLATLQNLESVDILIAGIDDAEWMPDAVLEGLVREALQIEFGEPLTQQAMENLVTPLFLHQYQITDLTGLEHATNLTFLALSNSPIRDVGPLAGLTQLQTLEFQQSQIVDVGPLARLTALEKLRLAGNQIRDIGPLAGLTKLWTLSLNLNQIVDVGALADLTELISLSLSVNQIRDVGPLAGLTQLETLRLASNQIRDIAPLASLTNITELRLDQNRIRDVSPLANLTKFEGILFLAGNEIVDVSPLANLTELRHLTLDDNQIIDVGPLARLTRLTDLYLTNNQIRDISPLSDLHTLQELRLAGNPIQDTSPIARLRAKQRAMQLPEVIVDIDLTAPRVDVRTDIKITEIMVDTSNGQLPQWIELTNVSGKEVSLAGWSVEIKNSADDMDAVRASVSIDLSGTLGVGGGLNKGGTMGKTLLLVAWDGRHSSNLAGSKAAGRIVDVSSDVGESGRYKLISDEAFIIELLPPQKTGVLTYGDKAGNLGATEAWDLPMDEGNGRSSLIRREMDKAGMETDGTDGNGWILAARTSLTAGPATWFGSAEDAGTPGSDSGGPLPVELSHFRPARDKTTGAVVITWATQSELNNAGFFIKRSNQRDGQFQVINATMIPGAGTTSEKQTYTYTDTTAQPNIVYYYQIEDVSLDGNRQTLTRGIRLKGKPIGAAGKLTSTWGELKVSNE